jgi:hypothetical protein
VFGTPIRIDCQPNCRGWVNAVGIVTAETPSDFDDFARDHRLKGETVVLDSSGGSVNDAIAIGRRFRALEMITTVGVSVLAPSARGERAQVSPEAYCESICVFLLPRCPKVLLLKSLALPQPRSSSRAHRHKLNAATSPVSADVPMSAIGKA